MSTANALVSVIVPTFDREPSIVATVRSVLAQTYRPIEVIVVDDGSRDDTVATLNTVFGDAIRIVALPRNRGRSTARNVGWALARGEFVAFIDSDDVWLATKLAEQMPHFADTSVSLVHCRVGRIDTAGAYLVQESEEMAREFTIAAARGYRYGGITETWCAMYTSAVVLRADLLRIAGGFDPRLDNFEDWDLFWRVARQGRVVTVPETLVLHRSHPGNTATVWQQAATPWLALNRAHLALIGDAPADPGLRRARGNLLLNLALGEYWRRDLRRSRRLMWRALCAKPEMLRRPGYYVWGAPLLHALLPHRLAALAIRWIKPDRYSDGPA